LFLAILILFSYYLSGCIENSNKNNDQYEYVYLSKDNVNNSLNSTVKWMTANLDENGFYNKIYDYDKAEFQDYENIYHQLRNSLILAELSNYRNPTKEIHKSNLNYIINHLYIEEKNISYIEFENKSELGYNAIFIQIILSSPFKNDYKDIANKLANTILRMQNENGSFQNDFLINNTNEININQSSDAIISLIGMYIFTNNTDYLNKSITSQNYYIKNYLSKINDKYYTTLIPGHTKSLSLLYKITNLDLYTSTAKILSDIILEKQIKDNIINIGHFDDLIINIDNNSYSSIDGFITEGIGYYFDHLEKNQLRNISKYKIGLILGVYNLINLQNKDINEKINGSIKFDHDDNLIRLDSTQNTIFTYLKILDFLGEDNWNYSYYPELDLLVDNIIKSRLSNDEVWYALFFGTLISIILVFLVYLIFRRRII
jgi:hypothetical protein